ncbi:MAG: M20/M25/M40 family metallo-hydrolase [Candidatus Aenigmatarchaeota archaeon]
MKIDILNFLTDFISIPSVSTQKERFNDILKAGEFLKNKFSSLGFKVKLIQEKSSPPLVLAYRFIGGKKTIGIYGHYDVQPEEPIDEWKTPPFRLTIKNGKIYGRGVADNKGHIVQNIFAIEELIKENKLKNNIVFLIEGEEESASSNFEKYVKKAKDVLSKVDVFYLTDVGMIKKNVPTIYYALRGIVYFELKIKIGESDLHSGSYGNLALNPVQFLVCLFSKIKDFKTGKILIPRFYEDVRKIDRKEKKLLKLASVREKEILKETKLYLLHPLDKKEPSFSSKIYPSMDINGIISGYTGEGAKTIIPKEATIKFSFRLIEYQKPEKIIKLVRSFIKENIPKGVKWELKLLGSAAPFYTPLDNEFIIRTKDILEKVFNNKVVFDRVGGSIPAAEILQRIYKKPIILTGFILPDSNLHAPNENFDEEMFFRGIEALKEIYSSI